jgi:acyl-CoA synthetase (AMP-forming)/AMP-acid ligase II
MTGMPLLLHDLLDAAAARWPTRTAVSRCDSLLNYSELAHASRSVAVVLRDAGVCRGDRVVLALSSGTVVASAVFAVSRLGAMFVPVHHQVRGRPLAHVLGDCEPTLLLTDDPAARDTARVRGIPVLGSDDLTAPRSMEPAVDGSSPLTVDPVCLIYTSGTTALPKAVVSTHQQVVFATLAIQSVLGYRDDDIVYCPLPLSFDYGLYQLFLAAASGGHVRLAGPDEAGPLLLRGLLESAATVLPAVPVVAESLAWSLKRTKPGSLRLRLLTNTGAAISARTLAALRLAHPPLRVQLMYGLTECKRTSIMPPDGDLDRPGSCGLALPGTEVFVVDDAGRRLAPGQEGQFVVRGPHVMAGYWRRPDLTAAKFVRRDELWTELRTGDYGWMDDDGYLYFRGRRDDLYKERGFRVSVTEVEAAAHRVDGVIAAAVLPPSSARCATLVVVGAVRAEEVLIRLRDEIEPFKIPRRCQVVDSLPRSRHGKVDRAELGRIVDEHASPARRP